MSILGDKRLVPKKVQTYIYNIQYIDTTTDHITPCSRMRARGNYPNKGEKSGDS